MNTEEVSSKTQTPLRRSPIVSTYALVSVVAYLIGVPKTIFDNEYEPPKLEFYTQLDRDKNARIVRNLCRLRTAIEQNFGAINAKMRNEYRDIFGMSENLPTECIRQLAEDGIPLVKQPKLYQYIIELNRLISDRINNCKELLPIWVNWQYVKDIFIMPNGLTEEGTKDAAELYYRHKSYYPYQVYINWNPTDEGNILYQDKKFAVLLYQWHKDRFTDFSKVSDVGDSIKQNIYSFLEGSEKTVIVVDCENSDPYKLCATLRNLDEAATNKIAKIILYDDIHATTAWQIFDSYIQIPVEYILIDRVKENKSLVDIRLTGGVCKEFFQNNADSFVLISSDSDYWGLISSLPEARFMVMVEYDKCGPDIKNALFSAGIFYCYLDDFYSGNSNGIKISALLKEVYKYLAPLRFNVNDLLETAYRATRVNMSDAEKRQFYNRYIKQMQLVMDEKGNVTIKLQRQ